MTRPVEKGKATVAYIPAGASSSKPNYAPNSPQIALQTTFPTEVPAGLLHDLAVTAGSDSNEDSPRLMSALLSEDSTNQSLLSVVGEEDSASENTWPTGGRRKNSASQETPYGIGISPPPRSRLVLAKESIHDPEDPTRKGVLESGGKPPLGLKPKMTATHSEPRLPAPSSDGLQHREPLPFQLSKNNFIDLQVGMELTPPIEAGRLLQRTQSLPVWMPSTVSATIAPEDVVDIVSALKAPPRTLQVTNESTHSAHSIHDRGTPVTGASVSRTKSMSAIDASSPMLPRHLLHSNTQVRRIKKNIDNANVRVVAQAKMSDRRKKKLMKQLATIQTDGGVDFDIGQSARLAKDLFGIHVMDEDESGHGEAEDEQAGEEDEGDQEAIPPLRIVMLIVGTRGDVQPFVAIGKKLQEYGHQVRLATHANFRDFVKQEGLEFYPLGGDPKVLAELMVKNKGFLPSGPSEMSVQRKQIKSIVYSLLPACIEPDIDSGVSFRPQAIIANPPAYGHVHVAEYLKVPLHIFFTMPWTATSAFPHPLSRVKQPAAYRLSYQVVDTLIWLGIRGIINGFRKHRLKLPPMMSLTGSQGSIAEMPTGYIWSPHLVPKPKDWGPLVDVVGFCFLDLADNYKPPEDLVKWLNAGPPPIYIGFGSLPVEDPEGMTNIIVEALNKTGQRGIIGKGWGGIGNLPGETPENVYLLSDCPHDWLFPHCAAVVHHGGAGTTAAGLKASCPTTVVPFFGDQPFWGERVYAKGVGPKPIPVKRFDVDTLVSAVEFMLDPAVKKAAVELAKAMEREDGVVGVANAFHKHIHKHLSFLYTDGRVEQEDEIVRAVDAFTKRIRKHLPGSRTDKLLKRHQRGILFRLRRKCKSLMY